LTQRVLDLVQYLRNLFGLQIDCQRQIRQEVFAGVQGQHRQDAIMSLRVQLNPLRQAAQRLRQTAVVVLERYVTEYSLVKFS
jgi:hypothetical protein